MDGRWERWQWQVLQSPPSLILLFTPSLAWPSHNHGLNQSLWLKYFSPELSEFSWTSPLFSKLMFMFPEQQEQSPINWLMRYRKVYIVSTPRVLKWSKKKAREIEKLLPISEFFISSTGLVCTEASAQCVSWYCTYCHCDDVHHREGFWKLINFSIQWLENDPPYLFLKPSHEYTKELLHLMPKIESIYN